MTNQTLEDIKNLPTREGAPEPGDVVHLYRNNFPRHAAIVIGNGEYPQTVSKLGAYGLYVLPLNYLSEIYGIDRTVARIPNR